MLLVQGLALYQLFSPFYLWPPKITLPKELTEPEEPLEYEVNLDPGPMGPTPTPKPPENASKLTESAAAAQTQSATDASSAETTPAAAPPPSPVQTGPVQTGPVQTGPVKTGPVQPSPAQNAAAVVSITYSTPAPQPLLALEATPAPSAPDIVLVPSVELAAEATTDAPAQERGAANGAPANSDAISTPVRPNSMLANSAPERAAAAPISILPGVQAPTVEPVIAANPVARAERAIDRAPVDLTIAEEKPVLNEVTAPAPAVDVTRPMRVQPENPKPDLGVEQAQPNMARPVMPAAAAQPVLSRSDVASTDPSRAPTPDLRVDADAAAPEIATPSAPAARPVLTRTPAKLSASDSVRLEVAVEQIVRPSLPVQGPMVATNAPASDIQKSDNQKSDNQKSDNQASANPALDSQASNNPAADASRAERSPANQSASPIAPDSAASTAENSATPVSSGATGLPSDPFARAGSGRGPRDLLGQGMDAAAAQVGENPADTYARGNAFRRYSDPFADDAPNPLAGLRLREPQLFSDVTRFLVKTFGPAALGFAVGASSEIDDFSGPNAGVLIDQWIQQHHSDLQRECRMRQETMDEHIRRLLCGEP